jgi:hypothetical protein
MSARTLPFLAALLAAALAWSLSSRLPAEEPAEACSESLTLFQDVSRFGRKNSAAKNMTELHAEQAREGWVFIDLEPYTENGDLEGFFLTYSRPAPCP